MFQKVKEIVASEPILCQFDWDIIFHVHVDALGVALGSILAQTYGGLYFEVYYANIRFSRLEQYRERSSRHGLCCTKDQTLFCTEGVLLLC